MGGYPLGVCVSHVCCPRVRVVPVKLVITDNRVTLRRGPTAPAGARPPYAFILVTSYRHDTLSDDRSVPMCNYTLKLGMPGTAERLGSKEKVMLNTRNIGCQTETRTPILAHFANVDAVRIDVWVSDLVLESDPRR